ncbi:hypothetical protein LSH36_102g05005 [Paralvinella palmiformis]|uniref:C2H2-type domain-containing protein n=1 Tax=Paralvinella palmiformis TaxID=53620 RepID=A0AAD9NBL2_9ANNE|nr:hypothetical protein LSH36_102g05005 [Paralvinella palmiformis]
MQLDRSKVIGEHDDSTTMVGGTYMCNLCQYKTNLKANFQLHCKTDKHLQRLQLVNHIREGGPSNEWRLKYMSAGNPIQVRCNACDYYTNSVHKLQLHRTNPRHETNAQLFHHLQTRETCLPPEALRYFTCTLCGYNTRTKINLIQHIHGMSHMRNESLRVIQLKEQGKEHEYVIENIFQVKEYTEKDLIKFDESEIVWACITELVHDSVRLQCSTGHLQVDPVSVGVDI